MSSIKVSSKVEEGTWNDLREHARESRRSVSGVLTEAIEEYLRDHWAPIEAAIKDQNFATFQKAFDECVDAANAWHEKKDKPHIRWKLPDSPPPDLDLTPRR